MCKKYLILYYNIQTQLITYHLCGQKNDATHDTQDLIIPTNDTNQNVTQQQHEWSDYDETGINQATINAIIRSRILGLFMLQNIITKLKQDRKNMTKEHRMSDEKIIIIDYRVSSNHPKKVTVNSDSQNNDEY